MKKLKSKIFIMALICFLIFIIFVSRNFFISQLNFNAEHRDIGKAILAEDIGEIDNFLKKGGDPNLINKQGISLLMFAVKHNKPESLKAIVKNGANVNLIVDQQNSAIETAIKSKNPKILELFIKLGCDVNLLHSQSSRPLNYAFYYKNMDAVEILMRNKADFNLPDKFGNTALINQIRRKDFKGASILLSFIKGDYNNPFKSTDNVKQDIIGYIDSCYKERHFKNQDYLNLVNELKSLGFQFKEI